MSSLKRYVKNNPYTIVVGDENCPGCGVDLKQENRVHVKDQNSPAWEQGSACPPFGRVTLDPGNESDPDDENPDLRMPTDKVDVTCTKCGHALDFTVETDD